MIINSTELQNNFGKYLMLAATEDIVITRNGIIIAKLSAVSNKETTAGTVGEQAEKFNCGGPKASYEEFLEITKNTEKRYEYIYGEIHLLASPKTAHQIVLSELFVIFYNWFQGKKCTPLVAPYDITLKRTTNDINVVQPDIVVICDLEEKLDDNDYYRGIPSLVAEVTSESTKSKDLIKKLDLYMSCDVGEYWIVNPANKEITIYQFKDKNISQYFTYRKPEAAKSYIFDGLSADLDLIFK